MKNKKILLLFGSLAAFISNAQVFTLRDAFAKARTAYPLTGQTQLANEAANINIENLHKGYLPQVNLNAQASYQSDVTRVNIPLPGIKIDPMSKDQYRLTADISQLVYDGGTIKKQQQVQKLNAAVEAQKTEVELYKLKERISQVYLGILLTDEQLKQTALVKADINNGIKKVEAQVNNGVAFRSNLNMLKAELLKNEQRVIELKANRKSLLEVLGILTNEALDENVQLQKPSEEASTAALIQRPEIALYDKQAILFRQQKGLIGSKNLPKASAFVQGGYGKPGLNMLKNSFEPFAIAGLRLNWNLGNLYTAKNEKRLAELNTKNVQLQKETFLLNNSAQQKQQQGEIDKLKQLITADKEIIELRTSIKQAANAQLENGVITSSDYLREVNAEDQARELMALHELQLVQAIVNLTLLKGQ
ncbi:MAG: TolC family protein [Ferruginibacter sp.]